VEIRFYAGAADAAGTTATTLEAGGLNAEELMTRLAGPDEALARVLACCSLLVDGALVRNRAERISGEARVDVLPPFAGG
jgi:molybdopterin converting factor small subunit